MSTPSDGDASGRSHDPFGGGENEQWPVHDPGLGDQPYGGQPYGGQEYPDPGYGTGPAGGAGQYGEWTGYGAQPGYGGPPIYGTQPTYGTDPMYGTPPEYGTQPLYGMQPGYGTQPMYGGMQPYTPGYPASGYPVAPYPVSRKEPAISLILSFFLPGLGTIVNGQAGKGLAIMGGYFLGVLLSIVLIGIPFMLGFWVWGMVDGYSGAKRHNARHGFA